MKDPSSDPASDVPKATAVEGGEEKEGDKEGMDGGKGKEKEREPQEEKQQQISYDYDELRSRPEVVDISPDVHLELQYPSLVPLPVELLRGCSRCSSRPAISP